MLARHAGWYDPGLRPVFYLTEKADWSVRQDALSYAKAIEARHPHTVTVTDRPELTTGRIAHFGSQFNWQAWCESLDPSTRQLVTYFHGTPEDGPEMERHVSFFLKHIHRLEKVVTAASKIETRLLNWGVPKEKLARIPLGIDLDRFRPPSPDQRARARARFGIPQGVFCIGSFQKDGDGWGEGLQPKLIKGPDIFIEAVTRLAAHFPIFVLLTGPARGFVKQGLEKADIPYAHHQLPQADMVADAFQALDLYLVASREEGGPKAVLESLATGVPLVSTRVGMAEDVIKHDVNGLLADAPDARELADLAGRLLGDRQTAGRLAEQGLQDIPPFAWEAVAEMLYSRVYRPLL